MSEVLVLIDAPEGKVTKPSLELLTIAARIGEPPAVFFGSDVPRRPAEHAAPNVYQLHAPVDEESPAAPKAEALAQVAAEKTRAAVLLPATSEGKEIGA